MHGREVVRQIYPHQIAYNCFPHIGSFLENGFSEEEMKMLNETRKMFDDPEIRVCATTVRIPDVYGHSESIKIETEKPISPEEARKLLEAAPGVKVIDDPSNAGYPVPLGAAGTDDTFVGRIRRDPHG